VIDSRAALRRALWELEEERARSEATMLDPSAAIELRHECALVLAALETRRAELLDALEKPNIEVACDDEHLDLENVIDFQAFARRAVRHASR
jgi:hypothetical protein